MTHTDVRHVKRARKRHVCDWCYEPIAPGKPYKTWYTFGECTTRMHPECFVAMQRADLYDECLPPAGTYRRGCWCGESLEHCTCNCDEPGGVARNEQERTGKNDYDRAEQDQGGA